LPATTSTKRKGIASLVGLAHRRCSVPTSCSPIATRFQRGASLRSLRTRQKWAQQLALRCRCLRLTASRALPPVVCAPSKPRLGWHSGPRRCGYHSDPRARTKASVGLRTIGRGRPDRGRILRQQPGQPCQGRRQHAAPLL
jgi:hypothetical protein